MGLILSKTIKALAKASAEKYIDEGMSGHLSPRGLCHRSIAHTLHLAYNVGYEEALSLLHEEFEKELKGAR